MDAKSEEAYFIGVLLGRGSLGNSDKHLSQEKPFGKYVLRIPSFRHTPLGVAIIQTLLRHRNGLRAREIIEKNAKLQANPAVTPKVVGVICSKHLMNWHPISLHVSRPLLRKAKSIWKVDSRAWARRYLREQRKYLMRNQGSLKYVLTHLQETLKDFSVNIYVLPPEPGPFNMEYFLIECHMPPVSFDMLNNKYGLQLGDAYRHLALPKAVLDYKTAEKQEFIRGLADSTVHFNQAPYWYGDGKQGLWQVRLTFLADSRPELCVEICRLLQENLKIPVLSINWIKGDIPTKKDYRGGRERHIILFVHSIKTCFPRPFFRNEWKEEFLEDCWQKDKRTLLNIVGRKRKTMKNMLSECPRTSKQLVWSTACIRYGCQRRKIQKTRSGRQMKIAK